MRRIVNVIFTFLKYQFVLKFLNLCILSVITLAFKLSSGNCAFLVNLGVCKFILTLLSVVCFLLFLLSF